MSRLVAVTWNAEGMFVAGTRTRRASPEDAISVIRELNADVIVIPEFGRYQQLAPAHRAALDAMGYAFVEIPYEQVDLKPEISMVVLSRLYVDATTIHRLGDIRNCVEVRCTDERGVHLKVLAIHLDDRAEQTRMRQIIEVERLVASDHMPTLAMGDFNAMDKRSNFARVARSRVMQIIARVIPHELLRAMAMRVNEMAIGTTIQHLLDNSNLHSLDPGIKRTISAKQYRVEWAPKLKLAKIDWIFGTKHFTTVSYEVWPDVGSDHRPVKATLNY